MAIYVYANIVSICCTSSDIVRIESDSRRRMQNTRPPCIMFYLRIMQNTQLGVQPTLRCLCATNVSGRPGRHLDDRHATRSASHSNRKAAWKERISSAETRSSRLSCTRTHHPFRSDRISNRCPHSSFRYARLLAVVSSFNYIYTWPDLRHPALMQITFSRMQQTYHLAHRTDILRLRQLLICASILTQVPNQFTPEKVIWVGNLSLYTIYLFVSFYICYCCCLTYIINKMTIYPERTFNCRVLKFKKYLNHTDFKCDFLKFILKQN